MEGTVSNLVPERGFGFITSNGEEFFFHRNALQGTDFTEVAVGTPVVFEVDKNPEGDLPRERPRAVNIRLAEEAIPAVDNEPLPPEKTGQIA
jgi:cold shock CspA family protein